MAPAGSSITQKRPLGPMDVAGRSTLPPSSWQRRMPGVQIVNRDIDQPHGRESHILALGVADAGYRLRVAGRVHAEIMVSAHFHGRMGPTRHGLVEIAQSGRIGYGEVDPSDLSRHAV